ncbi:stage VI sporulation protein F [Paenibacillus flagellatus]|uniref:Serine/threonine protein kinase n=1 Tax=Paenibacillus flagellatus TaxID=2211139 RepID=A0A2V5K517_9BACL|nr:stage VI sporulation protein F [Paenibacillus flagellatus]PYI54328.1 serine/threonine protein kinase [Paenibacillus flagellatus]
MSYQKYGIPRELVERVKLKLKNPDTKDRVKAILDGVTKSDLQDRAKVKSLLAKLTKALGEPISDGLANQIVQMVLDLKIDPNNTFHLIKLWGMFR